MSLVIEDHNAFVEGVVANEAILPAFGLATEIMREQASKFQDLRGGLG